VNKRDNIYYNYRLLDLKPDKWYWKLYCRIRKFITFKESPSKVSLWTMTHKPIVEGKVVFGETKVKPEAKVRLYENTK
jgi:hypothetical protein